MCSLLFIIPQTMHCNSSLQSIYIVFGVLSHLEVILKMQEDVRRLYANDTPFFVKY